MGEYFDLTVARDKAFHMPTYGRKPVMFVRGEGLRLFDDDGNAYLDFVGAIGSVNLGHAHPAVADAVCAQMRELVLTSNLYHTPHRSELAETLVALFGGGAKVFFSNSGAEANEGAIKLARKWGRERRGPECHRIVTAEGSFHGRTLGTLAATGQASKQESFAPLPEGFAHVPLNDSAALEAAVDERTCAVMLEPVLGESGVWPCDEAYLRGVERLCRERDVLLVLDEVQTGVYRTGPFLAHQAYGIRPHVVTMAKSLANGLPMGAILAADEVAATFKPGDHGSTFGGGPVVCAAALATLDAHARQGTGINAFAMGARLAEGLRALPGVDQVRQRGLMVGATLGGPVAQHVGVRALEFGAVVNPIGEDIIRFLPPLVCEAADIDTLLGILQPILEESIG